MELKKKIQNFQDWLNQNRTLPDKIAVDVEIKREPCSICGSLMTVQKTIKRTIVTLQHGCFNTHERVLVCPAGCTYPDGKLVTRRAETLNKIVPTGANYGYDLEAFVGLERFVRHRQREEIRNTLKSEYGIMISTGEISELTKRFLSHVEALHESHAQEIKNTFLNDDGYPMHIDATTEGGKGTLLVVYAGWRGWVLGAWRIPSESVSEITPRITDISNKFGNPCAIIRDLGGPMACAVDQASLKMESKPRILACHFHFLRDVGKDLLNDDYDHLRKMIRKLSVRTKIKAVINKLRKYIDNEDIYYLYKDFDAWIDIDESPFLTCGPFAQPIIRALGQWILDFQHDGKHLGFPFDRPYLSFYHRCRTANKTVKTFLGQLHFDWDVNNMLDKLSKAISPFLNDKSVRETVRELEVRVDLFDDLRAIFRLEEQLAEEINPNYINYADKFENDIKENTKKYMQNLKTEYNDPKTDKDKQRAIKIILDHLKKHGKYLWGHTIRSNKEAGGKMKLVDRTNNVLENFFHEMKHRERRRSGHKVLKYDFENIPPAAALVMNLSRPDYVKITCGSLDNLPICFSQIDKKQRDILHNIKKTDNNDYWEIYDYKGHLPFPDKRFIRKETVCDWILAASEGKSISYIRKRKEKLFITVDKKLAYLLHRSRT